MREIICGKMDWSCDTNGAACMANKYDSCALHVLTNNCDTDAVTATATAVAATIYVYIYIYMDDCVN